MVLADDLRKAVLHAAIQGKLTEQLDTDDSVDELLQKIKFEKEQLLKDGKIKREKVLLPIDEADIPFYIPDNWIWVKLGEIGITQTGTTPSTSHKEFYGDFIPFIKPPYIYNNRIDYTAEGLSQLGREKSRVIAANSLMMVCIGGSTGKCYYTDREVCCNQQINTLTPWNKIHIEYIFLAVSAKYFSAELYKKTGGTATTLVNKDNWNNIPFPLPPIAEQQRIVNRVNELMIKIDEYEKIEKQLVSIKEVFPNDMRNSILQAAMQGTLTEQSDMDSSVDELLQKIKLEKEQLIKDGKARKEKELSQLNEDDIPFEIPQNWRWERLGNIAIKLTDGAHKTPKYTNKGIPFLSVKDMSSGKLDFSNTKFISKEEHDILFERCNPEKGDLLITKIGTTGVPVIVDTDIVFSLFVSVALMKFNHELMNVKYLYYLVYSPLVKAQAVANTRGVGNQNWVLDKIKNTIIPVPPIEEQNRIVERLDKLLSLCKTLKEE